SVVSVECALAACRARPSARRSCLCCFSWSRRLRALRSFPTRRSSDLEECVTLSTVEPRRASAAVAQRPGSRHSLELGAPGIALLTRHDDSGRDPDVRAHIAAARERGYATSHDEVITGVSSVAVPIPSRGPTHVALGVVYVGTDRAVEEIAERLCEAARAVGRQVG